MKRVAPHVHIGDCLLDLRHVAGDAFAALASRFVMRVFLDGCGMRAVRRIRAVAIQTKNVSRLPQERVVLGTVRVMATEAANPARVHETGNEVIALHAILMASPVGEMREGCLAQLVFFQFPEVAQALAHVETDGPVVGVSR